MSYHSDFERERHSKTSLKYLGLISDIYAIIILSMYYQMINSLFFNYGTNHSWIKLDIRNYKFGRWPGPNLYVCSLSMSISHDLFQNFPFYFNYFKYTYNNCQTRVVNKKINFYCINTYVWSDKVISPRGFFLSFLYLSRTYECFNFI